MAMKSDDEILRHYEGELEAGRRFQDFVAVCLLRVMNLCLYNFQSKKYQNRVGENLQGFEIKLDRQFLDTKRFWMEVKERRHPQGEYVASGIFRNDNSWAYVIGNRLLFYVFRKNDLKEFFEHESPDIVENNRGTSQAFFLPIEKAEQLYLFKVVEGEKAIIR